MDTQTVEREFKSTVCEAVTLIHQGRERYRVATPFMFDDGDHLAIVLKNEMGKWILSDEGSTLMRLTYHIKEQSFHSGTRQKLISNTLSVFDVENRDGELISYIPEQRYGDVLYSYIQAILKISDISFLSREQIRSTFNEDLRELLNYVTEGKLIPDWFDAEHDPKQDYTADFRIEGVKPILVFALNNDQRVSEATVNLLQYEKWGLEFQSLGIFEDQEQINRKTLAKFSNVSGKQFSSLNAATDRVRNYLQEATKAG